jgi:hypothetical protein
MILAVEGHMADTKSDRLGVRGTLALIESALKLVGGANATGALSAGVAYHAFIANQLIQQSVARAGVLFLFGVFFFMVAYLCWFFTSVEMDLSLRVKGEEGPEEALFKGVKTPERSRTSAQRAFLMCAISGAASFSFFALGLALVLQLGIKL